MRRIPLALATAGLTLAIAVPSAGAATTRAEYVAQVDPICLNGIQQLNAQYKRLAPALKKANAKLKKLGDDPKSTRKAIRILTKVFRPYISSFDGVTTQLTSIPPAPGDESAVTAWLDGRRLHTQLLVAGLRSGRRGKLVRFGVLFIVAVAALEEAERYVAGFGFQYCVTQTDSPFSRLGAASKLVAAAP